MLVQSFECDVLVPAPQVAQFDVTDSVEAHMAVELASLPWYAYLAGFGLVVALVVLVRAVLHKFPGNRPPVYEEIPFIGGLVGFIRSPIQLATRGYKAVGEVSPAHSMVMCEHACAQ